jgi:hypothetical protein
MNVNDNAVCLVPAVSLRFSSERRPEQARFYRRCCQLFGSSRQVMLLM